MSDLRIVNLARTIVDYSTRIKANDQVFIMASPVAAPLVQELYKLIIQRGAHPLVLADLPGLNAIFFEYANWDMICDLRQGGQVTVDGELFMKDGKYALWE